MTMFKQVRPQGAVDEARQLTWGTLSETKAHLRSGDRELVMFWEGSIADDGEHFMTVYLEAEMFWETPRGPERLGLGERQEVKGQIQEGAKVLGYYVEFVDEAPVVV